MSGCYRHLAAVVMGGAVTAVLSGCMATLGVGGVNAVNVPAELASLAMAPPVRPASPPGAAPRVRITRVAPAVAMAPDSPMADDGLMTTDQQGLSPEAPLGGSMGGGPMGGGPVEGGSVEGFEGDDDNGFSDLATIARGISALRRLDTLIGATEGDVRSIVGGPDLIAPRPPGIQWNYSREDCVLQVHFFMEIATRDFRVLSYDLTGDDVNERRECASRFVGQGQGEPVANVAG